MGPGRLDVLQIGKTGLAVATALHHPMPATIHDLRDAVLDALTTRFSGTTAQPMFRLVVATMQHPSASPLDIALVIHRPTPLSQAPSRDLLELAVAIWAPLTAGAPTQRFEVALATAERLSSRPVRVPFE
jgi:hypothetical protein